MNKEENEKQLESIKLERGWTATNFAYLEGVISRIITYHYFSKENEEFVTEVLEDEYFNFGLLVKIFNKIISKDNIKFPSSKLYRLQQLRNIIVHSQITTQANIAKGTNKILSISEIQFKHGGKKYNPDKIFKEYREVEKIIKESLNSIPGGGQQKMDYQ